MLAVTQWWSASEIKRSKCQCREMTLHGPLHAVVVIPATNTTSDSSFLRSLFVRKYNSENWTAAWKKTDFDGGFRQVEWSSEFTSSRSWYVILFAEFTFKSGELLPCERSPVATHSGIVVTSCIQYIHSFIHFTHLLIHIFIVVTSCIQYIHSFIHSTHSLIHIFIVVTSCI